MCEMGLGFLALSLGHLHGPQGSEAWPWTSFLSHAEALAHGSGGNGGITSRSTTPRRFYWEVWLWSDLQYCMWSLMQGTGDLVTLSMCSCWRAGISDVTGRG